MKKLLIIILSILCGISAAAQNFSVSGKVVDEAGSPMANVAVSTYCGKEKGYVGTETKDDGSFSLELPQGTYTIEAALLGFEKWQEEVVLDSDKQLGTITLQEMKSALKASKVTASKIKQTIDGYEMNVKGDPLLSKFDLNGILRSTPGIMKRGSSLSVYGVPVSGIYINSRKLKFSGDALEAYLAAYQGKMVDKITVELSEDGFSGPVIRVKTEDIEGGFGIVSGRYTGNSHKDVLNPDLTLNYRKNKFTTYLTSSYLWMKDTKSSSLVSESEEQIGDTKITLPLSLRGSFGAGYEFDKNNQLYADFSAIKIERNTLSEYKTPGAASYTDIQEYQTCSDKLSASATYLHTFKDKSALDVDMGHFYHYKSQSLLGISSSDMILSNTFHANYKKTFKSGKDKLFLGTSGYSLDRTISYGNAYPDQSYSELSLSATSKYTHEFKHSGLSGAFRLESYKVGDKDYLFFTPSIESTVFLNRQRGNVLRTSWQRSSSKPRMDGLTGQQSIQGNDNVIYYGNPDLQLSKTDNLRVSLTILNNYSISAHYNNKHNAVDSYMFTDAEGMMYSTFVNSDKSFNAGFSLYSTFRIGNWCYINATGTFDHIESAYRDLRLKYNQFVFNVVSDLNYKDWTSTIWIIGHTGEILGLNSIRKEPAFINLNFGRNFCKRKIKVTAYVDDLLDSAKRGTVTNGTGHDARTVSGLVSTRTYGIKLAWNFRWGKMTQVKKFQSVNSDIQSRISD